MVGFLNPLYHGRVAQGEHVALCSMHTSDTAKSLISVFLDHGCFDKRSLHPWTLADLTYEAWSYSGEDTMQHDRWQPMRGWVLYDYSYTPLCIENDWPLWLVYNREQAWRMTTRPIGKWDR
jgi:hypothetical protein